MCGDRNMITYGCGIMLFYQAQTKNFSNQLGFNYPSLFPVEIEVRMFFNRPSQGRKTKVRFWIFIRQQQQIDTWRFSFGMVYASRTLTPHSKSCGLFSPLSLLSRMGKAVLHSSKKRLKIQKAPKSLSKRTRIWSCILKVTHLYVKWTNGRWRIKLLKSVSKPCTWRASSKTVV